MAEKNNAICSICGSPYYACLSCRDAIKISPWKMHCDTAEHYKIFQVVRGYNTGVYTKDEAKVKLSKIDLSDLSSLRPHIKSTIENILKEEVFVENIETETETEMKMEMEIEVEKPKSTRKKYSKVETE